jgi:hypothetical protein
MRLRCSNNDTTYRIVLANARERVCAHESRPHQPHLGGNKVISWGRVPIRWPGEIYGLRSTPEITTAAAVTTDELGPARSLPEIRWRAGRAEPFPVSLYLCLVLSFLLVDRPACISLSRSTYASLLCVDCSAIRFSCSFLRSALQYGEIVPNFLILLGSRRSRSYTARRRHSEDSCHS